MSRRNQIICFVTWLILLGWGLSGVYQRLTTGHSLANYGSYVPWGLWVSGYIYFVGLSAGAFLLSSLFYVFRVRQLKRIGRLALFLASITLLMSLVCIWFDLGHMGRFYEVFTRPNFNSMMAWMIWLYSAYFVLILAELWIDLRCDLDRLATTGGRAAPLYRLLSLGWRCPESAQAQAACHRQSERWLRVLGAVGIPLAIAFHGGVGALFATLVARPYWHTGLYPILFLTGALVSGGGLMLAMVAMTQSYGRSRDAILPVLGRIVLALLLFDLLLEWAEFSIPMWYGVGPEYELMRTVLFGQYWYVFWLLHILLGALVPILLLTLKSDSRNATAVAGGLVAVSFLAVRLNIVIPGQITPALRGLEEAYVDQRLLFEYVPSMFEWSVVAFVVAVGALLFYLGTRLLPLTESRPA